MRGDGTCSVGSSRAATARRFGFDQPRRVRRKVYAAYWYGQARIARQTILLARASEERHPEHRLGSIRRALATRRAGAWRALGLRRTAAPPPARGSRCAWA